MCALLSEAFGNRCEGIAESGIRRPEDLDRLAAAGARCFLVGETLMREPDLAAATRRLLGLSAGGPPFTHLDAEARAGRTNRHTCDCRVRPDGLGRHRVDEGLNHK